MKTRGVGHYMAGLGYVLQLLKDEAKKENVSEQSLEILNRLRKDILIEMRKAVDSEAWDGESLPEKAALESEEPSNAEALASFATKAPRCTAETLDPCARTHRSGFLCVEHGMPWEIPNG